MKYYEHSFEDYINAVKTKNIHPELETVFNALPNNIYQLENMIIYGPSGVGKYSQTINAISKYSPSNMKYQTKITINPDKQPYTFRISDIHYEIDMSLLGCNSKTLWHEIFYQIIEIISVKTNKIGIIICKNFHSIHSELLDIFYSYIQEYNHSQSNLFIKFIIITEHISFIPYNISNNFHTIKVGRPSEDNYRFLIQNKCNNIQLNNNNINNFIKRINISNPIFQNNISNNSNTLDIDLSGITNIKELYYFNLLDKYENKQDIPLDIFDIICNKIINNIINIKKSNFIDIREDLYNILTYNLDATECIWYIITYFINNNYIDGSRVSNIINQTYIFLKYYNNNYRPIYHLESIVFYIINNIYEFNEE